MTVPSKSVITESDLLDYPGMFLKGTGTNCLIGDFAAYPRTEEIQGGEFKQPVVTARHNFHCKNFRNTIPTLACYCYRVKRIAELADE